MDQQHRPQTLEDLLELQPGRRSWLRENWMAFTMFVLFVVGQLWTSTDWLHARETNEVVTKAEVRRLEEELRAVPNLYVRQDVFTQVLININQRLASIDNKLERR